MRFPLWTLLLITTPAFAELDISHFEPVQWETYENADVGLTIAYPYEWTPKPAPIGNATFYVSGPTLIPSIGIAVMPRPDADLASLDEQIAARYGRGAELVDASGRTVDGVDVRVLTVDWHLPMGLGLALKTRSLSFFRGDHWVLVQATDGVAHDNRLADRLQESLDSVELESGRGDSR